MHLGKIPNSLYHINTLTHFGSQRPIFKQKRQLYREAYVTTYMKCNYADTVENYIKIRM
jgi:hypothetical protein